jgi:hypothetical protein
MEQHLGAPPVCGSMDEEIEVEVEDPLHVGASLSVASPSVGHRSGGSTSMRTISPAAIR